MTVRRLALVLLDLIGQCRAKCGIGFGKYPLGLKDGIEAMLPLVPDDDPAKAAIDQQWRELLDRLKG